MSFVTFFTISSKILSMNFFFLVSIESRPFPSSQSYIKNFCMKNRTKKNKKRRMGKRKWKRRRREIKKKRSRSYKFRLNTIEMLFLTQSMCASFTCEKKFRTEISLDLDMHM